MALLTKLLLLILKTGLDANTGVLFSKESYQNQMADIEFTSDYYEDDKRKYRHHMQPNTSVTVEGVVAENSMMFPLYNKVAYKVDGLRNRYGCDPIEEIDSI